MTKETSMILFKKILKEKTLEFKQSDAYKKIITNNNKEVKTWTLNKSQKK